MELFVIAAIFTVAFTAPAPTDPMINEDLFEGDITGIDPYSDRNAVVRDSQLWPNGIIPYIIAPERDRDKKNIREAMDHIEAYSCIRFVERTDEKDYIKIVRQGGCWSHWGRTGGEQPVSLGNFCNYFGIIVHELLHAVGFEHEHNRSDRDDYLTIHWDNIEERMKYAFRKLRPEENRLLTQFDFASVMLYGSEAFGKDWGLHTMTRKDGMVLEEVHNKKAMSVLDAERINMLYKCKDKDSE